MSKVELLHGFGALSLADSVVNASACKNLDDIVVGSNSGSDNRPKSEKVVFARKSKVSPLLSRNSWGLRMGVAVLTGPGHGSEGRAYVTMRICYYN